MKTVGDLLSRFKKIRAPERWVKEAVIKSIEEIVNIKLDPNEIRVHNNILFLTTKSTIKNLIFEDKINIISRTNNILGVNHIKYIK